VLATSGNELQISVYKLYRIAGRYNLKISGEETKVMAFKGQKVKKKYTR
jgi:hypothetical protein